MPSLKLQPVLKLASFLFLLRVAASQANASLRLRGGLLPTEGRVEVLLEGQWGTVCDDAWSMEDATVACKQLGFAGADRVVENAFYGRGKGPIWLDEVGCLGDEEWLVNCSYNDGDSHCTHNDDAGVVCLMEDHVRLVGTSGIHEGRLEVYHDNKWGAVCDDNFGPVEGDVVCKELGFTRLKEYQAESYYGASDIPIWLDDVRCNETNSRLSHCNHSGWGSHNCTRNELVGISCEGVPWQPERPIISHTTCSSLSLHWIEPYNGGNVIDLYHVIYRPHYNDTWTEIRQASQNLISYLVLTDLLPSTTFEVSVSATNDVGTGSFSELVAITTGPYKFGAPNITAIVSNTPGSLMVSWEHTSVFQCDVTPTSYMLRWSDGAGYSSAVMATGDRHNHTLSGLLPGTTYMVSVLVGIVTATETVLSPPSKEMIATVMAKDPIPIPTIIPISLYSSSAVLGLYNGSHDPDEGYLINCVGGGADHVTYVWGGVNNVTITNLLSDVLYECRITSQSDVKDVGMIQFNTTATAPTELPRQLYISNDVDNNNQKYLHWLPPATIRQTVTEYIISCAAVKDGISPFSSTLHQTNSAWQKNISISGHHGNSFSIALPQYTPGQLISCRVATGNSLGIGPYAYHIATINDPMAIATTVKKVEFSSNENEVVFYWEPLPIIEVEKFAVIGYFLSCGKGEGHMAWGGQSSMATVQLSNEVDCNIAAFNSIGIGPASETIRVQPYGNTGSAEQWNTRESTSYILLVLLGITMAICVISVLCLCCFCCHRKQSSKLSNHVAIEMNNQPAKGNTYSRHPAEDAAVAHYESVDVYEHNGKSIDQRIGPIEYKIPHKPQDDTEMYHHDDEYITMSGTNSLQRSDTLRSHDLQMLQHNSHHGHDHYDVPPGNNHYSVPPSNKKRYDHYDTPASNQPAI